MTSSELDQEQVREICRSNGWNVYPGPIKELPDYAPFVDELIGERAIRDLPLVQFQGRLEQLRDCVEIGGILRYRSGVLSEQFYFEPDESNVTMDGEGVITSKGGLGVFRVNDFENSGDLIHYHSHFSGEGKPSDGDVGTWGGMKEMLDMVGRVYPVGNLFFTIFSPRLGRNNWYAFQELEE